MNVLGINERINDNNDMMKMMMMMMMMMIKIIIKKPQSTRNKFRVVSPGVL